MLLKMESASANNSPTVYEMLPCLKTKTGKIYAVAGMLAILVLSLGVGFLLYKVKGFGKRKNHMPISVWNHNIKRFHSYIFLFYYLLDLKKQITSHWSRNHPCHCICQFHSLVYRDILLIQTASRSRDQSMQRG